MLKSRFVIACSLWVGLSFALADTGHREQDKQTLVTPAFEVVGGHPTEPQAICNNPKRHSNNKAWDRWLFRLCQRQAFNELRPARYLKQYANHSQASLMLTQPVRYVF